VLAGSPNVGMVITMTPDPGVMVATGSAVTITVGVVEP